MTQTNFDTAIFSRKRVSEFTKDLTIGQLNKIPDGLNHNIIWTMGHMLVSQQLMVYRRSSLPLNIKSELLERFKSGTAVTTSVSEEDVQYIRDKWIELIEQTREDYENGLFKTYDSFVTKLGIVVNTIEDALWFSTFHDGVHLGWIMEIRKLVQ